MEKTPIHANGSPLPKTSGTSFERARKRMFYPFVGSGSNEQINGQQKVFLKKRGDLMKKTLF